MDVTITASQAITSIGKDYHVGLQPVVVTTMQLTGPPLAGSDKVENSQPKKATSWVYVDCITDVV